MSADCMRGEGKYFGPCDRLAIWAELLFAVSMKYRVWSASFKHALSSLGHYDFSQ